MKGVFYEIEKTIIDHYRAGVVYMLDPFQSSD